MNDIRCLDIGSERPLLHAFLHQGDRLRLGRKGLDLGRNDRQRRSGRVRRLVTPGFLAHLIVVNGLPVVEAHDDLVVVIGVHLLLTRTALGRAMRAVSENPQLAGLAGVNVRQVIRIVWILGAGLAAVAGVIAGLLIQIRPQMGLDLLLPLFAAAILGGIGSVPGAMLAGLTIGLSEAATVDLLGAQWRAAVSFFILVAVLLIRPQGLFGRAE